MSETPSSHPAADQLRAFGMGQLTPAESTAVEAHLTSCLSCRTLLDKLTKDTAVLLAGESGPSGTALSASEPETLALVPGQEISARVDDTAPGCKSEKTEVPAELAAHTRYRILEKLGSGGMGTVYRARHLLMEREVALKVINPTLINSPTMVERFRREVKTAARLAHPNIVTAHDAAQVGDTHFLVMEYVPGISLSRLVAEKGQLPVTEACNYARQVALGLQHASECGMVHRDIKPQNLMRTPTGQIKILDFGLSRLANEMANGPATAASTAIGTEPAGTGSADLTQTGGVMGTPDYIAPEQIRDAHAADIRADIYSLGCTLYHLLTGRPPFAGKTNFDKMAAHLERQPRPLQELRPEVPAKLAAVVARMMAKSPKQRYQTPAAVAEALAPFAGVVPVKRPWTWALAAVALVCLAIGSTVAILAARNHTPTPGTGQPLVDTRGELVVDTPEHAGLLVIQQDGRRVHVLDMQNEPSCKLDPGDYDLSLSNGPDYLYLPCERCQVTAQTKTTIRIEKAKIIRVYKGLINSGGVCVAVTPDGRRVLAGGWGNTLRMWDVATGKELCVFDCPGSKDVFCIAFSPDGRSVAWGAGPIVRLSDLESGQELGTFVGHTRSLTSLAFSPDGMRLLSGSADGTMRLWDVKTRKELDQFVLNDKDWVWSVAFTPDGLHALTSRAVKFNNIVPLQMWDLQTKQDEHRLDASKGTFNNVAVLSADGQRVLAGSDDKMFLWDLDTGKEIKRFTGHTNWVRTVAFLPDPRYVLSGSYDGTARLWDVASGQPVYTFAKHEYGVKGVAVAPDGRHVFSVGDDAVVRYWRLPLPDPVPQR